MGMNTGQEFEDFVRQRSAALLRTACALVGDYGHAEDMLQRRRPRRRPGPVRGQPGRDGGPGSSRPLAVCKTAHAIFLTCTDALPKASLGAYLARLGGHRITGLDRSGRRRQTATHCQHAGLAPIRRQCRIDAPMSRQV